MNRITTWTAVALAAVVGTSGAAFAGSIAGTITYDGNVPKLRPVSMDADPGCSKKHTEPVGSQLLVLGDGNTMGNILVSVTKGAPAGASAPSEPVVMDQKGCMYDPHVMGIQVNQKFKILNSDGILHNVHALPEVNKEFNMAMPASRTEAIETFTKTEGAFKIKCDVHPWMNAYVAVFDHPYFDVTGPDGAFEIGDLPAGEYEITAWHEKLGVQKQTVTVADGAATADITFSPPPKK